MAVTERQQFNVGNFAGGVTSLTATFTTFSTAAAGNWIIACVGTVFADVGKINTPAGWTKIGSGGTNDGLNTFVKLSNGTETGVAVTASSGCTYIEIHLEELTGVPPGQPTIDGAAQFLNLASGSGGGTDTYATTPSKGGVGFFWYITSGATSGSTPTGFTLLQAPSATWNNDGYYLLTAATDGATAPSAVFTYSPTGASSACLLVIKGVPFPFASGQRRRQAVPARRSRSTQPAPTVAAAVVAVPPLAATSRRPWLALMLRRKAATGTLPPSTVAPVTYPFLPPRPKPRPLWRLARKPATATLPPSTVAPVAYPFLPPQLKPRRPYIARHKTTALPPSTVAPPVARFVAPGPKPRRPFLLRRRSATATPPAITNPALFVQPAAKRRRTVLFRSRSNEWQPSAQTAAYPLPTAPKPRKGSVLRKRGSTRTPFIAPVVVVNPLFIESQRKRPHLIGRAKSRVAAIFKYIPSLIGPSNKPGTVTIAGQTGTGVVNVGSAGVLGTATVSGATGTPTVNTGSAGNAGSAAVNGQTGTVTGPGSN